jgi:NAD(P)-dependent dehydrogenase (short-subunit alcohol dehydrogenase family)
MSEFCNGNDNSLSVLLNNAGILEVGAFEDISNNQHQRVISVNAMGVINLCQAAWPYLKNNNKNNSKNSGKDNNKSTIVNTSSASSDYGVPELASYSASKFAVKALTEALELEWQKYGIRVCDVMPPLHKLPPKLFRPIFSW